MCGLFDSFVSLTLFRVSGIEGGESPQQHIDTEGNATDEETRARISTVQASRFSEGV